MSIRFTYTEAWTCPFCGKGQIAVAHKPSFAARTSHGAKSADKISKEEYNIVSEKCPECGKTAEEIEEELERLEKAENNREKSKLEKLQGEKKRLEMLISMGKQVAEAKEKLKEIEKEIGKLGK